MRIATIAIQPQMDEALERAGERFVEAFKTGDYQGEWFGFESPAALFQDLTPGRWVLIETLQHGGPMSLRGLARHVDRDAANVHRDVVALKELGLIEDHPDGGIWVPFDEIRFNAVLKRVA